MIGEPHLNTLEKLTQPKSPTELAEELGWSVKHASEILSELRNIGLVTTEKAGRPKIYTTTETSALQQYRTLTTRHPNIDFPELLTPSSLNTVYYLKQERTADRLTKLSKPSRSSIYRALKTLRNRGMISKKDGRYSIREPYEPLVEFSRELALLKHVSKVQSNLPTGNHVVWNNDHEYIAIIEENPERNLRNLVAKLNRNETEGEYYLTGLAELNRRDMKFMTTPGYHLFYTEDELKSKQEQTTLNSVDDGLLPAEDLVCHMAITQERAEKSVGQRYTLLYLARTRDELDIDRLRDRAIHYDMEERIRLFLDYLKSKGEVEDSSLPTWSEFTRAAETYDVEVGV